MEAPPVITPGGNPVTEVPGASATSPVMRVGPVLVMVVLPSTATESAPPRSILCVGRLEIMTDRV